MRWQAPGYWYDIKCKPHTFSLVSSLDVQRPRLSQRSAKSHLFNAWDVDIIHDFSGTPTNNQQDEARIKHEILPHFLSLVGTGFLSVASPRRRIHWTTHVLFPAYLSFQLCQTEQQHNAKFLAIVLNAICSSTGFQWSGYTRSICDHPTQGWKRSCSLSALVENSIKLSLSPGSESIHFGLVDGPL